MRLAIGISYNGYNLHGWQKQNGQLHLATVQGSLEKALLAFTQEFITLHAAGRTDSGVHAIEQVAHFDTTCIRKDFSWVIGVNAQLNQLMRSDIRILWAKPVDDLFHARFSASARTYNYVVYVGATPPVCFNGLSGYVMQAPHQSLNILNMQKAAQILLGEHDFSSFRSSICQAKSPIKTMHAVNIRAAHPWYVFTFTGSAFLHHMVRNIMGCLIKIGLNKQSVEWMQCVLDAKNRSIAAPTFMPYGLYLSKIHYDNPQDINLNLPNIPLEFPWL
jgi:tRNA pseudouridine38-40 synthase